MGFIPSYESAEMYAANPYISRMYGFQFTAPNGDIYLGNGRKPNLIVRVSPEGVISQVDVLPEIATLTRVSTYISDGSTIGIEISNMFLNGIEIEVHPIVDLIGKSPLLLTPGCIHVPPDSNEVRFFGYRSQTSKGFADSIKRGLKILKLIQKDVDNFLDLPQSWVDTQLKTCR